MPSPKKDDLMKHALGGIIWKFSERVLAQLVSLVVSVVLENHLVSKFFVLTHSFIPATTEALLS